MKKLNWKMIKSNIAEARDELEVIEAKIDSDEMLDEVEYQIKMEHVYHHLNFAWNARNISRDRYVNLTDQDFNKFGKFPEDIELAEVDLKEK